MIIGTLVAPRILVAGVGNIFLGDDAFGVEVAQRLALRPLPEGVRVVDFGIRGLDLAYSLLDPFEAVILLDAAPRGQEPGTLYLLELDQPQAGPEGPPSLEPHNLDPARVLRLATALGGPAQRLFLVGCEPTPGEPDDFSPMCASVRAAVDDAIPLVESLVKHLLAGHWTGQLANGSCEPLFPSPFLSGERGPD